MVDGKGKEAAEIEARIAADLDQTFAKIDLNDDQSSLVVESVTTTAPTPAKAADRPAVSAALLAD
jgi:hypothetical protein